MKNYIQNTNVIFIILFILFIVSCKQNNKPPEETKTFADLVVDPGFTFNNSHEIQANFVVIPELQDEQRHIIAIYQGDPAAGGRLLSKGITNTSFEYSVKLKIPKRIDKLFVENSNADGIFELVEIPLSGNVLNHTFNTKEFLYPVTTTEKTVIVDPGCGNDCDETISGTYSNLLLEKKNYCVAEGTNLTITGQLQFKKHMQH